MDDGEQFPDFPPPAVRAAARAAYRLRVPGDQAATDAAINQARAAVRRRLDERAAARKNDTELPPP